MTEIIVGFIFGIILSVGVIAATFIQGNTTETKIKAHIIK